MWQVTEKDQVTAKREQLWSMLAVVGVIAALLWFVWPSDIGGVNGARSTATMASMKQLAMALQEYAVDNDGRLPAAFSTNEDLQLALVPYELTDWDFKTRNPDGGEILPNSELAGVELSAVANPEGTVLIYESKEWANGRFIISAVNTSTKSVDDRDQLNFDPGTIESETVD